MNKLAKKVDEIGRLKAEIADLTTLKRDLEDELIESGETEIEGRLFRSTVSHFWTNKVNWKGIATKLKASKRLISANTKEVEVIRVNTNARKAA